MITAGKNIIRIIPNIKPIAAPMIQPIPAKQRPIVKPLNTSEKAMPISFNGQESRAETRPIKPNIPMRA